METGVLHVGPEDSAGAGSAPRVRDPSRYLFRGSVFLNGVGGPVDQHLLVQIKGLFSKLL